MEPLTFITNLAVILLAGLVASFLAKKLKLPNAIFLVLAGILLGNIPFKGEPLINLPDAFITSTALLALIMIIFDGASRLNWKEFDDMMLKSLRFVFITLIVNIVCISLFLVYVFNIGSIFTALLISIILSATAPDLLFFMLKDSSKTLDFLKMEAVINTPITVLLPFIIIDFYNSIKLAGISVDDFIVQIIPFLQQIVTGIGAGILVGLIVFKFLRDKYSETYSPLLLIAGALLSYILAENLMGNGVLAVTTLGLFFGKLTLSGKKHLQEFSTFISNFLEIIVFVMVGFIVKVNIGLEYLLLSILLYIFYIAIRFVCLYFLGNFNLKEKIFMALTSPKGIAVATVTFILATYALPDLQFAIDLIILMLVYSILVSSVVIKFSKHFIRKKLIS